MCSHVSRYTMSTAFLATAHFRDQDSLSARIVQARFTGMFRFSCKALKGERRARTRMISTHLARATHSHPLVRVSQTS